MSDLHPPQEILDYIIDFLHDETKALRQCCLVSKSLVPRTRKHLFATVELIASDGIKKWKKAFPDPSKSPGYHTHTLKIKSTKAFNNEAEAEWITAFSRVIHLEIRGSLRLHLARFHRFSDTLKSLQMGPDFGSLLQLFNLISSLPFLEDLTLLCAYGDTFGLETFVPSLPTGSALTGVLDLHMSMTDTAKHITSQLLKLPNGVHFRILKLDWNEVEVLDCIAKLVEACSGTLECLYLRKSEPGCVIYSVFCPICY